MKSETMKRIKLLLLLLLTVCLSVSAQEDSVRHEVLFETSMGNIRVVLYNETPLHRDNFLKLVNSGFYDGILFHRVIDRFMIQAGDPTSKTARAGELLGENSEGERIPAEIVYPKLFHKRGALAAARQSDEENPARESSGSQFYIVYGKRYTANRLFDIDGKIMRNTNHQYKLSDELYEYYQNVGGSPHLDGQYTVFGEVVEGIDVVANIEKVETDENNRPLEDVKIIRATVIK